jgi:hypothetical protein
VLKKATGNSYNSTAFILPPYQVRDRLSPLPSREAKIFETESGVLRSSGRSGL